MKYIPLQDGLASIVDDSDYDFINSLKWYAHKGSNEYYARCNSKGYEGVFMHRLILGITDLKSLVDHQDHNGLNNQRRNLRLATHSQNSINRRKQKNCSSVYIGVYWNKIRQLWQSYIKKNSICTYLGAFENEEDAAFAYDNAARKEFGEFANLNFK